MILLKKHVLLLVVLLITCLAVVLRVYNVSLNPPGLYIDEVSIGNNAYAILKSGVDEHGVSYPLWFKAFGEYKLPVYIYAVSGFMAFLGKSEIAVRLPSIIAGSLSVPVLFGILSLLVEKAKDPTLRFLPIVGSFLLAITPWHIHFSRGGFEATVALFLLLLGIYCYLLFLNNRTWYYLTGTVILSALTMYTYNSYRVIAILTVTFLLGYAFYRLRSSRTVLLIQAIVFSVLILPVIMFSLSPAGSERFQQISALSSYEEKAVIEQIRLVPMDVLHNYIKYFSFEFLFTSGDRNGRHQVPGMGLLYRFEIIFFIAGIYGFITRKKTLLFYLTFFLLTIAPLAAALTIPSPHALRSLLMVIPMTVIVGLGVLQIFTHFKKSRTWFISGSVLLSFVMLGEMSYYLHLYSAHYPSVNALDWGGSYKETVKKTRSLSADYDKIVIDRNMGQIEPYFLFYDSALTYTIVQPGWSKPDADKAASVLLIRPDYKEENKPGKVGEVTLQNRNNDIFAEFYSL